MLLLSPSWADAEPVVSGAAPRPPSAGAAAAPRPAAPPGMKGPAQAAVRRGPAVLSVRGAVRWKRAADKGDDFTPLVAPQPLARRDEVDTGSGGAELLSERGMIVELAEDTLIAIIGAESGVDAFLARGGLRVRPGDDGEPHSVQIVTAAGRVTLRGKDVRLRIQGDATVISAYDGVANVWGTGGGVVRSGQTTQLVKGKPLGPQRPLLTAPGWSGGDILVVQGERPQPITLRFTPFPGAVRHRLELLRTDAQSAPVVLTVDAPATSVVLPEVPVGLYAARITALGEAGALGEPSEPRRVVVAALLGAAAGNIIPPGTLPRLATPVGLAAAVQVDGEPLRPGGLAPGAHRLQVQLGGLSTEVAVRVERPAPAGVAARPQRPPAAPRRGTTAETPAAPGVSPETARAPGARPPDGPDLSRPPFLTLARPAPARPAAAAPVAVAYSTRAADPAAAEGLIALPPEDIILGGAANLGTGAVRSPWAGRLLQVGFEGSGRGETRLLVHGRYTLRSGLGAEVNFSALRLALGDAAAGLGGGNPGLGGLRVLARSPALRRPHLALQATAGVAIPLGAGPLERGLYEVPDAASPVAAGGYRVEAALLLGARHGHLAVHTQHGLSLRVSDGLLAGYEGGLGLQADASRHLRVVGLLQLAVNLLGAQPGAPSPFDGVDVGGAVGGGLELTLPAPLGGARLALLGRAGLGAAGAALYGRAYGGAQLGYRFR